MRKLLILAAVAGGILVSAEAARAEGQRPHWPIPAPDIHDGHQHSTSVTWPSVTPSGWYTNTYRHKWYYPWYAYYNFSMGPYANWMAGGGYAAYASNGPAGMYYSHKPPTEPYIGVWYTGSPLPAYLSGPAGPPTVIVPKKDEKQEEKKDEKPKDKQDKGGTVSIVLPTDATLLFNGVAARGTGGVRTFQTPPLHPGQDYQYELTAEVVRNGRTERATGTVIVRAGETATVVLTPIPAVALK